MPGEDAVVDDEVHVVDQSGGDEIAHHRRTAADAHVPASRGFAGGLQRLGGGEGGRQAG